MSDHSQPQVVDRPVCQAATPAECSGCSLSYDCARVRTGRQLSWGLVALALVVVLTLLSKVAAGW